MRSKKFAVFMLLGTACIAEANAEKGSFGPPISAQPKTPLTQMQLTEPAAQASPSMFLLKCKAVKSSGVPEGRDSWFAIRPQQHTLTVHHEKNGDVNPEPIYKFSRDYGDVTVIRSHAGGKIHKLLVFSDRGTVPNMFEIYMSERPIRVHWVYIQGMQAEQVIFQCVRRA